MSPFDQKKASILLEIATTLGGTSDDSPKGSIDTRCVPIMDLINSHDDMVTTSSCSGRVSVFVEGIKETAKIGSKGNQGRWLYVNHEPDIDGWYKDIDFSQDLTGFPTDPTTRFILYKYEPLILHVKCRNAETANQLYTTAMNCGFRESGVGSNFNVAIRISIKLDIPIGYLRDDKYVVAVNDNYLDFVVKLSKDRFEENFRKLDQLHRAIAEMKQPEKGDKETKEERRERKRREGLARQQQQQQALQSQ